MSSWSSSGGSAAADRCGSPSSLLLVPGTPSAGRSTEEIWKDINFSFLKEQEHHHRCGHLSSSAASCFGGFQGGMLCESFPGLNREKQGRNRGPSPVSLSLGSSAALPDPATCLSLYWNPAESNPHAPLPPKAIDRRGSKNASTAESEDKRRRRLMKNRESADRSRARKQAYTNELENEVALLRKENAWLRSQQEKIWSSPAVPSDHHHRHQILLPEKIKLHRTLTAPF